MARTRLRVLLVCVLLLLAVGSVPLLRSGEERRQAAWEAGCVRGGGAVWSAPAPRDNPLVVQLPRPTYECRDAAGVRVSTRD